MSEHLPNRTDSKQKYWGMGLAVLGFVLEFWASTFVGPTEMAVAVLVVAVGMCAVGVAYYSKAKGSSYVWGLFGLVPVLGFLLFLFLFPLFTDFRHNWVGFVLSLAIMGILAAIAIPNFMTYGAKARQSEAKVNLGGIFVAAMSMKEEQKTFVISDINHLGFSPSGVPRYSLWYAVNGVPTMIPSANLVKGPCDVTTPPTTVRVAASATGFTAAAKGNMDNDATCDEWSINDAKVLTNTLNDVTH